MYSITNPKVNPKKPTVSYITKRAVVIHKLLSEPLVLIISLFATILTKSVGATPFQIAILTSLKPGVALLILYWSATIHRRRDHLAKNVFLAGIFARIPFFLFPWIQNAWLLVACVAWYFFFYRAEKPAWTEIIKINLAKEDRSKIVSFALALAYAEGVIIALCIGPLLQSNHDSWRYIFPIVALVGVFSSYIQKSVPLNIKESKVDPKGSFSQRVMKPWQEAYDLMLKREDFRRFQMGYFLCGFGLMMMMPVLSFYYVDTLKVSYKELAMAILICKGVGYASFSKFWSLKLEKIHIFKFMIWVLSALIVFTIFMMCAVLNVQCLYVSFFIYGIAQAGSQLSWGLSGPIFAKNKNSTVFTSINVLMVGIRGLIAPLIGGFIYAKTHNPYLVFSIFIILTLFAMRVMYKGLPVKGQPHFS